MDDFLAHLLRTLLPLSVAAFLGGLVGLEREAAHRPAGLRTHLLVCVGAALIMQVSMYMYELALSTGQGTADPGRISAQVVSGIGFLGAGTIMREGIAIRGLTTAASLWVVAGVGLAVGADMYLEAILVGLMVVATLRLLSRVEARFLLKRHRHTLTVRVADTPEPLGSLAASIERHGGSINNIDLKSGPAPGTVDLTFCLELPSHTVPAQLLAELMRQHGVTAVARAE